MTGDAQTTGNTPLRQITLLAASTITVMAGITIAPAGPSIHDHFADSPDVELLSKLVITLPSLFIAICAPLAGLLIDRIGRRPLLLGAIGVYGLAGMAGLVIDDIVLLLVRRAVLGAAAGAVMTAATTLIGDYYQGEARDKVMGLQAASMALAGVLFVIIGGALAALYWRGPFWVYAVALVLLPLASSALSEPDRRREDASDGEEEADYAGLPLFIAMIILAALVHMTAYYLTPVQLPFLLRDLGIVSPLMAAAALFVVTLVGMVASALFARTKALLSHPAVFAVGFGLMAVGYFLVATAGAYWQVLLAMLITGAGMGTALPNYSVWVIGRTPLAIRGRVVGGCITAFFLGQFLSPLLAQPVVAGYGLAQTFTGAGVLLGIAAVAFAIAAVAARGQEPQVNKS